MFNSRRRHHSTSQNSFGLHLAPTSDAPDTSLGAGQAPRFESHQSACLKPSSRGRTLGRDRTPERMEALFTFIQERQNALGLDVTVFGEHPDGRIPGLKGPRAACHEEGILRSDVILVPLEDGDRCQALVNMGKTVLVIDLNPMSRSAQQATITIVDELSRTLHNMLEMSLPPVIDEAYQHQANLQSCLSWMAGAFERA